MLAVFGAATFAALLLFTFNRGAGTARKIQLQNAADATAISGAAWAARAMNIVAVNNVLQTDLLAFAIIIPAMQRTLDAAQGVLAAQTTACAASVVAAPICLPILQAQQVYLSIIRVPVRAAQSVTRRPSGLLWRMMRGLGTFSETIVKWAPAPIEAEAFNVATSAENGAEVGGVVGRGRMLVPAIPARRGSFRNDMCKATRDGSPSKDSRGYHALMGNDLGEGPLDIFSVPFYVATGPIATTLAPVFLFGFIELEYYQLCGGARPRNTVTPVSTLRECRAQRGGLADWWVYEYESAPTRNPEDDRTRRPARDDELNGQPCTWTPPGSSSNDKEWKQVRRAPDSADGEARYDVTIHVLRTARIPARQNPGSAAAANNPRWPFPMILGETPQCRGDVRGCLEYFGVARTSSGVAWGGGFFEGPFDGHRFGYAQARVYNPTAFDLYTQDWRVKLTPATMLEDGLLDATRAGGGGGARGSGAAMGALRDVLGVRDVLGDAMANVNNH